MSRHGQNPLRQAKAPNFIRDIVCLVVTHLPNLDDPYHQERFEVVKTCLTSMRSNCQRTHTFYVFDNGSNDVFRDWLYNEFKPDMVTFSKNIGKTAARTTAIASLPVTSIVCYSDDDILFYPNWLNPQIELLNFFPNVSVVSCYPVRTMFRFGNKKTLAWAAKNATVEAGRFLPEEYEMDYAASVGQVYEEYKAKTEMDKDIKITYQNKSAYATSHHCQFIGYVGRLLQVLSYDNMAMGDERKFDDALDMIGLRLSTLERYCYHMGNVIDENIIQKVQNMTTQKVEV